MTRVRAKRLPQPKLKDIKAEKRSLPFNGNEIEDKQLIFSFATFDRTHELFNLGGIKNCYEKSRHC